MTDDELIIRACETSFDYLALGNERFQAHEASFVRSRQTPRRHDANLIGLVRARSQDEIDALLQRFRQEYEGADALQVSVDALTPDRFVARLLMEDGYKHAEYLVQLLDDELRHVARPVEIKEAVTEEDWAAYMELDKLWWLESSTGADQLGRYDVELHEEFMLNKRLKQPEVRSWLAYLDGEPRAFLSSFPGRNGVGMVEDLFCQSDYRHRGLASALLAHAVADARQRGASPVLITADPASTPKQMYAAFGFRPLYVSRTYTKRKSAQS
jgi:GNAT superfamily N-acetyltransferase